MKKLILSLAFAFAVVGFSPVVFADQPVDVGPPGNNGTLKVHEKGTPSGTESNDPKVCVFNFEGFGFDEGQDGFIEVDTQGGGPTSTTVETLPFGPANSSGYYETEYINDGVSGFNVPDGHYKATLYGKDTGGDIDRSDEKAKSKVFKVNCEDSEEPEEPETPVTPETPRTPLTPSSTDVEEAQVEAPAAGVNAGSGDTSSVITAAVALIGSVASLAYGVIRFGKFGA